MRRGKILVILFLAVAGFTACKTLKEVNEVSAAASTDLQEFDHLNTSVTETYVNIYREHTYGDYTDNEIGLRTDTPRTTSFFKLSLVQAKRSDTLLRKVYSTLNGYFAGMAKLAADSLIEYTLDTVTDALTGGTIIDTNKISTGTISAIGLITGKVGEFFTSRWRLHHIEAYIVESDTSVQRLVKDLKISMADLRIFLATEKQFLKREVYEPMEKRSESSFERKTIVDEYFRVMASLSNKQQRLDSYMLSLDTIAAANSYLCRHVDELRSKPVRKELTHYASVLKDQHSEFGSITAFLAN